MSTEQDIYITIEQDRSRAFVALSGKLAPALVTSDLVSDFARRAGVAFDKDVAMKINGLVVDYAANPRAMKAEISTARPPGEPVDAALAWLPTHDPNQPEEIDPSGCSDHYAGRRLVIVRPGEVVAKMLRAADGVDGRDVTGRVLKPRAPKACTMKLGRGLTLDAEGRVLADFAGVIEIENSTAKVTEHMHVAGDVDFNTGHIDFTGAVSVSGGVKPGFNVKATGDLQIGGLVEDATTICAGSLDCRRGMTAKARGEMTVGRDAQAVFLNCMHGVVGGNLTVHREIMNCDLEVRGDLTSPRAVMLGGTIKVLGCAELSELGSDKWRETDLVLGWSVRAAIDKRITELRDEIQQKKGQHGQIQALGKRATASQRESLTELEFQLWELEQEMQKRQLELAGHMKIVQQPLEAATRVVLVHKCIHPKVRIHLGSDILTFSTAVRGPIRISLDEKDRLIGVVSGCPARPLTELARGIANRKAA